MPNAVMGDTDRFVRLFQSFAKLFIISIPGYHRVNLICRYGHVVCVA